MLPVIFWYWTLHVYVEIVTKQCLTYITYLDFSVLVHVFLLLFVQIFGYATSFIYFNILYNGIFVIRR